MARAHAAAERRIDATPEAIYGVLADYRSHHPQIMPSSFSNLEVEEGGTGDGTVFHITFALLGRKQTLHMRVSEPAPGSVLTETDLDSGVVTRFEVEGSTAPALTRISSEWETHGVAGWIDGRLRPRLLRRVFTQQLNLLSDYLNTKEVPS